MELMKEICKLEENHKKKIVDETLIELTEKREKLNAHVKLLKLQSLNVKVRYINMEINVGNFWTIH